MINLAGKHDADVFIQQELLLAGIEMVESGRDGSEVPYTITGKLGNWKFNRNWYYWVAKFKNGEEGLPLEIATLMYERTYPIIGENQPKTYGEVIRVDGGCECIHPRDAALPTKKSLKKWSKENNRNFEEIYKSDLAKLCNKGTINAPRYINVYHIDNQIGLNEFARVLREYQKL